MNRFATSVPRPRVGIEILVLLLLAASLAAFGYWFYIGQKHAIELDVHAHLSEITQLKASEIAAWKAERFGDAQVAQTIVRQYPAAQQELLGKTIQTYGRNSRYGSIQSAEPTDMPTQP